MSIKTFSVLKAWQLKYTAFLMGVPSTGTKIELETAILDALRRPLLPKRGGRILSIDMGIRNLAYTVVDTSMRQNGSKTPLTDKIEVQCWRKLDVLERAAKGVTASSPSPTTAAGPASDTSDIEEEDKASSPKQKALANAAFSPSNLSKTAYGLARHLLEQHRPDTILIERQRFRSAGGSAIQEWTVRVNMLESMLWACFETLRQTQSHSQVAGAMTDEGELKAPTSPLPPSSSTGFPSLYEVSPKRVARFWTATPKYGLLRPPDNLLNGSGKESTAPVEFVASGEKATKADRINILRSMISGTAGLPSLTFETKDAQNIAASFLPKEKGSERKGRGDKSRQDTKLDDLTDCILQAVAWTRWEENRRNIAKMMERTGE